MANALELKDRAIKSGDGFAAHEIVSIGDDKPIIRMPGESLEDFTKRAAQQGLGKDSFIIQVGGDPTDAEFDKPTQPAPNGL